MFGFNYALNWALTDVHRERRSVCVSKFAYNADGTIPTLPWFEKQGVDQVGTLNPYVRNEAETIASESGVKTSQSNATGVYVTHIVDGSSIRVAGVDFGGGGPSRFTASLASGAAGGTLEIHLDTHDGPLLGTVAVPNTHGWWSWQPKSTPVARASGVHDLYFVFRGSGSAPLFNFDSWKFDRSCGGSSKACVGSRKA